MATMAKTASPRSTHPVALASRLYSEEGSFKVYKLDLEKRSMHSDIARQCLVKAENQMEGLYRKEKTILLVGQSGSGKSTLIDAMLNYIVGVKREDPYRFKLIDLTEREKRNAKHEIRANTMAGTPADLPIRHSTGHSDHGPLKVYKLRLTEIPLKSQNARKYTVDRDKQVDDSCINEKTILLVGQSGSGKSTMIDAMVNYYIGVRREDQYRFKLIEMTEEEKENSKNKAKSETVSITCYTIPPKQGPETPYTVNIVNTPGIPSTEGTKSIQQHRDNIKIFFSENNILLPDAVCFIVKASDTKLTATQQAIFAADMQIFGKGVQQNILIVTFCDNKNPPAMKTIEAARIHFKHHYCVNNAALYDLDACGDDPDLMCKLLWEMTESSMNKFFGQVLQSIASCSIPVSAINCNKKHALDDKLATKKQEVDDNIRHRETRIVLENERDDCQVPCRDTMTIPRPKGDRWAMNCTECHTTCHQRCLICSDYFVWFCNKIAMSGQCKECSHSWKVHQTSQYRSRQHART